MIVLAVLVVLASLLWSYVEYRRRDFYKKLIPFKGPKAIFPFGNALDFPSINHILPTSSIYHTLYNGKVHVKIGIDRGGLSVSDYNFVEALLKSSRILSKGREYSFLSKWLAEGLLTSTGKKWQQRRKLLTPAFHFQMLEQIVDVFNDANKTFIAKLQKEVGKDSFDVFPYISLCTLDIICETAMGIKIKAQENDHSDYVKSVKDVAQIIVRRTLSPWKQLDFLYWLSEDYRKEKEALKILHDTTDNVIKKRRQQLEAESFSKSTDNEFGKKKRKAFLDLLLTSSIDGQPLSNKDIREEVDTFMFEGHDTTSSGIAFSLFNLGRYPELQEKVYEEQKSIFGSDMNRPINYNDLQDMKYLEMFIKESLRMYPPVPIYTRILDEETEIDGHILPKELDIQVYAYGLMRNKNYFPNPEYFDPERFSVDNRDNIKPYAYIPFSAGPRNCIGQKFAMMELKATVSKVVRNFKVCQVDSFEPVLCTELILKSSNGVCIKLAKRH